MLRESNLQTLNWADKTMSVLRLQQLEACQKRLSAALGFGLFSGCDDLHVEELWQASYEAQEQSRRMELHTTAALQKSVMAQLPQEAALLSVQEHMLVERMLLFHGEAVLLDVEEAAAAESLLARMWCSLRREEDQLILCLSETLWEPLMEALSGAGHKTVRQQVMHFDAVIRGLIYIGGFLHYEEPYKHFLSDVMRNSGGQAHLAMRFLRASYDYFYDAQGEMILLHPGLADPGRLIQNAHRQVLTLEADEAMFLGAINGILPEEVPLFLTMCGLLQGAVRPEITPEEAAIDLRLLAKQGVPREEINQVLSSQLMVLPTSEMLEAVKLIDQQTPRWPLMHSAVLH